MKRLIVFSIACLFAFLMTSHPVTLSNVKANTTTITIKSPQVTYKFTIVNKTGYEIKELYFSPSSAADWDKEDELLKGQAFHDGESGQITYTTKKNAEKWDLMCAWADGSANSVWNAIDLNGATKLTLTYDKASDTTYVNRE